MAGGGLFKSAAKVLVARQISMVEARRIFFIGCSRARLPDNALNLMRHRQTPARPKVKPNQQSRETPVPSAASLQRLKVFMTSTEIARLPDLILTKTRQQDP
jgi:hypothetical protein